MSKVMEVLDRHVQLAMWAEHYSAPVFWATYLGYQESEGYDWPLTPGLRDDARYTDAGHFRDFETLSGGKPSLTEAAELYAESIAHMMGMAETYYITSDICDVIEEAAPSFPRDPLRALMVPAKVGWIEFGNKIILGVDKHDEPWGPIGVSWRVEGLNEHDDYPMSGGIRWHDQHGEAHLGPGITIVWWQTLEEVAQPNDPAGMPWAAPGQVTGWAFDVPWSPEDRDKSYTLDDMGETQRKILMTTFNLLMDELIMVGKERPNRSAVRRAAKALKSPEYGDVNVVELRKIRTINYVPPEPDDDADPIHWTHRWIVRPHWRTLNRGTVKEKHVWVRKHVKGPDNKPLIVKDRLNLLKR